MEPKEFHDTFDEKELKVLEKFKTALATEIKYITPDLLFDNDKLILFLRARKLDIPKAKTMLMKYLKWYDEEQVFETYKSFHFDLEEDARLAYAHDFHKMSKSGEPIFIQALGDKNVAEVFQKIAINDLVKYSTKMYETMLHEIFPACSKSVGKYVNTLFSIIDLGNLGTHVLNKKVYSMIKADMEICQNYYPECLGRSYIINCGFLFKGLYTIIKGFLDVKTRSKIKVFGSNYRNALLELIDIDSLPKFLGGNCQCEEGCLFSREGPWKTKPNPPVSEELMKKRKGLEERLIAKLGKKIENVTHAD